MRWRPAMLIIMISAVSLVILFGFAVPFLKQSIFGNELPIKLNGQQCTAGISSPNFPLKMKWCLELSDAISGAPRIRDGIAYVCTMRGFRSGTFHAVDINTGKEVWSNSAGENVCDSGHWVVTEKALVTASGLLITALERTTGQVLWSGSIPNFSPAMLASDDHTIFAVDAGSAYWLDLDSAAVQGVFRGLPSHTSTSAYYIPDNHTFVIPTNYFYAFAPLATQSTYQSEHEFSRATINAAVFHDRLLYGDAVIDAVNGDVLLDVQHGDRRYPPAIADDVAYFLTTDQQIRSLNLNPLQNSIFTTSLQQSAISNLVAVEEFLFVVTGDDKLRSYNRTNGSELGSWFGPRTSVNLGTGGNSALPLPGLVATNNILLMGLGTNLLYAFETNP